MNSTPNFVVLGSGGAGKSSLRDNLKHLPFQKKYLPTRRIVKTTIEYDRKEFNIIEYAGQEFHSFKSIQKADIVVILYRNDNSLSVKDVDNWLTKVRATNPRVPILFVGNDIAVTNKYRYSPVDISINCKTGAGIAGLMKKISNTI